MILYNTEQHGEYILSRIAQVPQVLQDLVGSTEIALQAVIDHLLHQQRMRFIANLTDKSQSGLEMNKAGKIERNK